MIQHRTACAALLGFVLAGCGSSKQESGPSPLSDLASRLPDPSVFSSSLTTNNLVDGASSALLAQILDWAGQIDSVRTSWCHGKTSIHTDGSIVITTRPIREQVLLGFDGQALDVTRHFVAGAANTCDAGAVPQSFDLALSLAAFDANGAPIPLPWPHALRLDRVVLYGQFSSSGTFASDLSLATPSLAFVLATGLPTGPLTSAGDFAHLPRATNLVNVDAVRFTCMFFPNHIRDAGVAFGNVAELPDVLTFVVDGGAAAQRSLLALFDWATPANKPLALDLRVQDGTGLTGAAVWNNGAAHALFGPFFVALGGASANSGFLLDGTAPANLLQAWDSAGNVTHTTSTQGSFVVPAAFAGWPGDSTTWVQPLGQGSSAEFATALAGVGAASTWFGHP